MVYISKNQKFDVADKFNSYFTYMFENIFMKALTIRGETLNVEHFSMKICEEMVDFFLKLIENEFKEDYIPPIFLNTIMNILINVCYSNKFNHQYAYTVLIFRIFNKIDMLQIKDSWISLV